MQIKLRNPKEFKLFQAMNFHLFFFLILLVKAASGGTVTSLPGYHSNTLPFKLETGYVGVENDNLQLFYYFVESERDPSTDPILFSISGGPGCSGLWSLFFGIGPLTLDLSYNLDDTTQLPTLLDNPYSWSKFMNIIFLDGPTGTGFSYAKTQEGYNTSNFKFADNLNEFIHKWVDSHDRFKNNAIYISGDGFSGNPIPIALDKILKANEIGTQPHVNMGGYVLIGPGTDFDLDFNSRYVFANKMGLIADDIWKVAEDSCDGDYFNPKTDACKLIMENVIELVGDINMAHILEPACGGETQGHESDDEITTTDSSSTARRSVQQKFTCDSHNPITILDSSSDAPPCRKDYQTIANAWVDYKGVKEALQVRESTTSDQYQICDRTVDNEYYSKDDIRNLVPYHKNLSNTNIRGLIMSGDHDMDIPNVSIEKWISSLELNLVEKWRVWSVANETAGYTRSFQNGDFNLTYVSVKGGGHFIPQYKVEECYYMLRNWTAHLPL